MSLAAWAKSFTVEVLGSRGNYAAALRVCAHDYRHPLQLRVKHLLHRSEEGIQLNIEDTASHETYIN